LFSIFWCLHPSMCMTFVTELLSVCYLSLLRNFEAAVMVFSLTWEMLTNMKTNSNHSKLINWAPQFLRCLEKRTFFLLFFCFWLTLQNLEAVVMFFSLTWEVITDVKTNSNHSKQLNWSLPLVLLLRTESFFFVPLMLWL
jgi:hypothetical protein